MARVETDQNGDRRKKKRVGGGALGARCCGPLLAAGLVGKHPCLSALAVFAAGRMRGRRETPTPGRGAGFFFQHRPICGVSEGVQGNQCRHSV